MQIMRKMKDSGIEWIGEIPEGWEVAPLKRFAAIQTGNTPSKTSDANYYAANGIPWIKPDNLGYSHPILTTSEYLTQEGAYHARIMPPNTVFVCCVGSLGKVGFSSTSCACNQQINALVFNDLMFWKYGYYLTIAQESQYLFFGNGNVLQIINSTNQSNIVCVLPSLENQRSIVYYLDSICSAIEVLISKTRSSIEEYKKLKQAVITQAVTKGVRCEREMKPTGFTRWSDIPFDWDLKRVKSCVASISSGLSAVTDDANSEESGKFVLRTSAVSSGFFIPTEVKPVLKSTVNRLICPVEADTLIVSRMNTASMVGACAYVANNHPNTFLPDKLWKIKFLPNYHTKYMWYALNSVPAKSWFSELATGASSSMQNISINDFTSNYLPIPAFSEQKEIADCLDAKCAEIDGLIAKKEQLVKELESYKKSLIYEVVTGKREV